MKQNREHYTELPITRNPVNKTAALVVSKGWEYKSIKQRPGDTEHFELCPKIRKHSRDAQCINLTGVKFGYFTVVGLMDFPNSNCTRWVVRCACGTFELRKTKTVKLGSSYDRCYMCKHLERTRRGLIMQAGKQIGGDN